MKKPICIFLMAALLAGLLLGCGGQKKTEVTVFAAASMTETLESLKSRYELPHPEVQIVYNFDSSGTLKTQIQAGAVCDIFISASPKQMDQLDSVLEDSRIDLLENRIALVVPAGNPAGIGSFADLAERLSSGNILLAMGNADVPVGQYTQKILAYYGLDEALLASEGCLTYGSNVKEVTTQVSEGVVDCGIVYATDACSAGLQAVDTADAQMCGQVIYPAARIAGGEHPVEAQAFLDFLTGDEARTVFEAVGFRVIG